MCISIKSRRKKHQVASRNVAPVVSHDDNNINK